MSKKITNKKNTPPCCLNKKSQWAKQETAGFFLAMQDATRVGGKDLVVIAIDPCFNSGIAMLVDPRMWNCGRLNLIVFNGLVGLVELNEFLVKMVQEWRWQCVYHRGCL